MGLSCSWLWSVIWFFVLILIAIPVAFIAAPFYILLSPFAACCGCIRGLVDFIHKGVQLPYTVAVYMVSGTSCS